MHILHKIFYSLGSLLILLLIVVVFVFLGEMNPTHCGQNPIQEGCSITQDPEDDYYTQLELLEEIKPVYNKGKRELMALESMCGKSPDAAEIRRYLEWFFSVPWMKKDKSEIDLNHSKQILDRDHHGLGKAKDHILEYLAVQKRVPNSKAPIICFVGPPGVGKTTLAKSIAEATGRKFVRVSLGGVHDEGNIRGWPRSYIGSRPGEIVKALKEAGVMNPVILLDEIDKVGNANWAGDPAAALLEVLDPSQNGNFKDHFIEVGIDLSQVMFIATANSLEDLPRPLLDRLEIIELSSYTHEEKMAIAKTKLLPKQFKENGIQTQEFEITDEALMRLINEYTLESGVRELERSIGTLCRKTVKEISEGGSKSVSVKAESLEKYLGQPPVPQMKVLKENTIGKVNGLFWSSVGGGVMTLEALVLPGKGKIIRTGNIGNLSQDSIMAALTAVKNLLPDYKLDSRILDDKNIHIHFPGATKSDGPSAGIAIATAIMSTITQKPVRKDVCMTGEIGLLGDVLPIGGLKEKLVAAHRLGLKVAIISSDNVSDLEDVPEQVKKEMNIIPVKHISEVLKAALVG